MKDVNVKVRIELINGEIPARATEGSAGYDLRAAEDKLIIPGRSEIIRTGIKVEIPEGYELQARPRSGLAAKKCLTILNAPGTIDSDYRGEVHVNLINLGFDTVRINKGDRIAQLLLTPVYNIEWEEVDSLTPTARGTGGHGSTGIK